MQLLLPLFFIRFLLVDKYTDTSTYTQRHTQHSLTNPQVPFKNLHNFTQKAPHIHFYINRTMVEIINQFISAHPVVNFCYFMVYERSKDLQWRLLRFYKWLSTHTPVVINECKINFYYLKLLMNYTLVKSYHTPLNLTFQSIMIKGS